MKRLFLALVAAAMIAPTSAQAEILINIDLSIANQVTMTATTGLSSMTITGSDGIGIYFEAFYAGAGVTGLGETLVAGDLTSVANPTDNTPNLFRLGTADTGLNLFSWTNDANADFTAGAQAFTGSATWTLDADDYADMFAGATGGDIYFPADDSGDVAGATAIGEYSVTRTAIPEPGSLALLGMMGVACIVRRRRA